MLVDLFILEELIFKRFVKKKYYIVRFLKYLVIKRRFTIFLTASAL